MTPLFIVKPSLCLIPQQSPICFLSLSVAFSRRLNKCNNIVAFLIWFISLSKMNLSHLIYCNNRIIIIESIVCSFLWLNNISFLRHCRQAIAAITVTLPEWRLCIPWESMIHLLLMWWYFGFWFSSSICLLLFTFQNPETVAVSFCPGFIRAIHGRVWMEGVFSIFSRTGNFYFIFLILKVWSQYVSWPL